MSTYLNRCGMIGENHYFEGFSAFFQIFEDRLENKLADLADRNGLYICLASVTAFVRSFNVPSTYDLSKVQARCRHGVLHLLVPRAEATKPKKIQVQVE